MGRKYIIFALTVLLSLVSCQKERASDLAADASSMNPQASLFFSNLSSIIRAVLECLPDGGTELPFMEKLATVKIELEDGSTTSFPDLPVEQQVVFVDMFMRHLASLLSEKIQFVPELEQYVAAQNGIVSDALAAVSTRSGAAIDDPAAFLADLGAKMDELAYGFSYDYPETKSPYVWQEVEYDKVFNLLAGQARRGDLIVALPWHGHQYCLLNPFREAGRVGHSEIFTSDITASTTDTEYVSVGVRREGGCAYQVLPNWRRRSYLLDVCDFRVEWKWDGWDSGFRLIQTPVENPGLIAEWAEKYVGHEYCYWYENVAPKWVAPERFTCTTLVWWCVKNACGIMISPWLSTMVSPSDVLCDFNTRLKVVVE